MTFTDVRRHSYSNGGHGRAKARWQALMGLAGPAVLAALLPAPGDLVAQVSSGPDAIEVLGAAMMLAVTALVWGLLAWAVLVGGATLLTPAPGVAGRVGGAVLKATAPAAARRILIVATGVSLVAGASACGTAAAANTAHGPNGSGAAVTAVTSGSAMTTVPDAQPPAGATSGSGTSPGPAYSGGYAGPGPSSSTGASTSTKEPSTTPAADPAGPGPRINLDWPVTDGVADQDPSAATDPTGTRPSGHDPHRTAITSPTHQQASRPGVSTPGGTHPTGHPSTGSGSGRHGSKAPTSTRHPSARPAHPASANGTPAGHRPASRHPSTTAHSGSAGGTGHTASAGKAEHAGNVTGAGSTVHGDRSSVAGTGTAPSVNTVTVRPGDSLWTIAAGHLPTGATDAQVDAAWRAWYAANRSVIGANPNLIMPGQHLTAPDTEGTSS